MENVRIDTGCVYNSACLVSCCKRIRAVSFGSYTFSGIIVRRSLCFLSRYINCRDCKVIARLLYISDFLPESELHTVCIRILCECNIKKEWVYDSTCRAQQRTSDLVRQVRFLNSGLVAAYDLQTFDTVLFSLFKEVFKCFSVFVTEAYDQRCVPAIREIQLFREFFHHF